MHYSTFNGLYTLFLIIIFIALILWAYSKKHIKSFDEIANSILTDEPNTSEKKTSETSGVKK
ncbi:CcoQ/FixQ family Cbb3-type cytochrome c oxidase assembly chaperone [Psychromonas sp. CD1]|uniref:CcoQ/FixQ family Cbb3-type cytochrome c oxidase assembly chaperone n=1 Tax=Psychromonas sp. CD1 TaxID=1979839 RepID=UPI000B9B4C3A|nr:CcoQ/FixQ family Cbb3-type cytochrome c oxidase assembly chaperone [Psychromonas sp. CD1]